VEGEPKLSEGEAVSMKFLSMLREGETKEVDALRIEKTRERNGGGIRRCSLRRSEEASSRRTVLRYPCRHYIVPPLPYVHTAVPTSSDPSPSKEEQHEKASNERPLCPTG
jgi:hypothetical protein